MNHLKELHKFLRKKTWKNQKMTTEEICDVLFSAKSARPFCQFESLICSSIHTHHLKMNSVCWSCINNIFDIFYVRYFFFLSFIHIAIKVFYLTECFEESILSYIDEIKYTDNVQEDQRCLLYCVLNSSIPNGLISHTPYLWFQGLW